MTSPRPFLVQSRKSKKSLDELFGPRLAIKKTPFFSTNVPVEADQTKSNLGTGDADANPVLNFQQCLDWLVVEGHPSTAKKIRRHLKETPEEAEAVTSLIMLQREEAANNYGS
jgi:hypothetical protein